MTKERIYQIVIAILVIVLVAPFVMNAYQNYQEEQERKELALKIEAEQAVTEAKVEEVVEMLKDVFPNNDVIVVPNQESKLYQVYLYDTEFSDLVEDVFKWHIRPAREWNNGFVATVVSLSSVVDKMTPGYSIGIVNPFNPTTPLLMVKDKEIIYNFAD
jgi:hypothetical protein